MKYILLLIPSILFSFLAYVSGFDFDTRGASAAVLSYISIVSTLILYLTIKND